jgi:hypothetical protein
MRWWEWAPQVTLVEERPKLTCVLYRDMIFFCHVVTQQETTPGAEQRLLNSPPSRTVSQINFCFLNKLSGLRYFVIATENGRTHQFTVLSRCKLLVLWQFSLIAFHLIRQVVGRVLCWDLHKTSKPGHISCQFVWLLRMAILPSILLSHNIINSLKYILLVVLGFELMLTRLSLLSHTSSSFFPGYFGAGSLRSYFMLPTIAGMMVHVHLFSTEMSSKLFFSGSGLEPQSS